MPRTFSRNLWIPIWIALLMLPLGALAQDTCTTDGSRSPDALGSGKWRVVTGGAFPAVCPAPFQSEECTGVEYAVTNLGLGDPDHVAILVGDVEVVVPGSQFFTPPCQTDTRTGLGGNCHMRTVRLNRNSETQNFLLVVRGRKALIPSTIAFNKGKVNERCRISSLGVDRADPFDQTTVNETIDFKGCVANIPIDPITGEGGIATLSGGPNCRFVANGEDVTAGELVVNGANVGAIQLGRGFVSSGTGSCTTKIINRQLYTWCTCAAGAGDPRPPCP